MLGHAAGDELLVQVAKRLRDAVRGGDLCVRLGGDEFVVCCPRDRAGRASTRTPLQLAERLLDALNEPYDVHGHEMLVGASIGIAGASRRRPGVGRPAALERRHRRVPRQAHGPRPHRDVRRRAAPPAREGAAHRAQRRPAARPAAPADPVLAARAPRRRAASSGSTARSTGRPRACASRPTRSPACVDDAGMSRALDVALVRTMLAQLAEWERRPPGRDRARAERRRSPARGALSPVLPELVRDMLARSAVDAVVVLARRSRSRGRARSRGGVARRRRARRARVSAWRCATSVPRCRRSNSCAGCPRRR